MFNIGLPELIVIGIIALFVVGPEKLPETAKKIAKFINDLKRSSSEFTQPFSEAKDNLLESSGIDEIKKAIEEDPIGEDDSDSKS